MFSNNKKYQAKPFLGQWELNLWSDVRDGQVTALNTILILVLTSSQCRATTSSNDW